MGHETRCLLFAPSRPPLRLEPGREVVLGRSRSCELTLDVGQASRRHAAVRFEGGHFLVRDLRSTNGTLLNGEPLRAESALQPGDRIEIGGVSVIFCQVDEAMEEAMDMAVNDPGEGQTILMARPASAPTEALRGSFEQIPSFAVLQILEMGNQSGVLCIENADGDSRMWLEKGRVSHAETEKAEGFDAAIQIVQSTSGRFFFEPGAAPAKHTMNASVTEVVLEGSRILDEAGGEFNF